MAEDLTDFLNNKGMSELYAFRYKNFGTDENFNEFQKRFISRRFDILIGLIYCARLDLPEVALVAILDADREGF